MIDLTGGVVFVAEKYLVEGYEFDDMESANEAKKELEAVKYMAQKMEGCSPREAYLIYNKIVDENLFKTVIGYDYLHAVEEYLIQSGMFNVPDMEEAGQNENSEETLESYKEGVMAGDSTEIPKILQPDNSNMPAKPAKDVDSMEKELKKTKDRLMTSILFNIVLVIGILVMIYIASTSSNVNILNYETALQDKYSSWAEELKEKEESLKEREKAVEELEKK